MPRGYGYGAGMGWQMRGGGYGRGFSGNPSPYCRFNPSLPRRWWAASGNVAPTAPDVNMSEPLETEYFKEQALFLKNQLEQIERRIAQLEKKE